MPTITTPVIYLTVNSPPSETYTCYVLRSQIINGIKKCICEPYTSSTPCPASDTLEACQALCAEQNTPPPPSEEPVSVPVSAPPPKTISPPSKGNGSTTIPVGTELPYEPGQTHVTLPPGHTISRIVGHPTEVK